MPRPLHYWKIHKRVFNRLFDTLTPRQRIIVTDDIEREQEITKWFYATLQSETESKFVSPTYWMNDPFTFKSPAH